MDPITIAATVAGIGKLFQGVTGFFGGHAQADYLRRLANQRRQEAAVEANIALEEGERAAATGAVRAAAGGGGVTGSAIDVLSDVARQSMFNARSAIYRGRNEAQDLKHQGRVEATKANIKLVTGVVDAGSSFLSESAIAAERRKQAGYGRSGPTYDPMKTAGAY